MSLEETTWSSGQSTEEVLAELTDRPVEDFEYDGEIPELDDLEWEAGKEDDA